MKDIIPLDNFIDTCLDLLESEQVQSMTQYNHHGPIDTHYHSVHVAYYVYKTCNNLKFNEKKTKDITRASLLHDLYLYNWYTDKHDELHAWYHPKEAVKNIEKYHLMELSEYQKKMILNHMFPLGHMPVNQGGWILTLCDKYCACKEIMKLTKKYSEIYQYINEKVGVYAASNN